MNFYKWIFIINIITIGLFAASYILKMVFQYGK